MVCPTKVNSIAATALEHDLTIVTRTVEDFRPLLGPQREFCSRKAQSSGNLEANGGDEVVQGGRD